MKHYNIYRSKEVTGMNRHYIQALVPNDLYKNNPKDFDKLHENSEKFFLEDVINIIENCLFLKRIYQPTGYIQTLRLYEAPEGAIVEIANDDFEGIMVESENAEIINKIYERLLKL